jgi:hypothetical protein
LNSVRSYISLVVDCSWGLLHDGAEMDHILVIGRNFEVEGWTSGARCTAAEVGVMEGVGMGVSTRADEGDE